MKFRIIALGKDFSESNRLSHLCQQITVDEFGFQTLGLQFHWEIMKDTYSDEAKAKMQECVEGKTILDRPFKLQEVTRTNPTSGEIITKLIAGA
jgi:hypothetical protein